MIRADIKEKLDTIYAKRMQDSIAENIARKREVSENHKDLQELIDSRQKLIMDSLYKCISQNGMEIDIKNVIKEKNAKIRQLLTKYGYPENYLEPTYYCSICKDQGKIYDEESGTRDCECYIEEYLKIANEIDGFIGYELASFENSDFNVFSKEIIPAIGISQKNYMENIYSLAKKYCEEFPDNSSTTKNLFLYGGSGLGKTFLLNCIKNELIKKKCNVKYLTAYNWFQKAKDSYFGNNIEEYNSILDCDLIILDDLGTEPQQNNINIPQLFNIINERQNMGKHFIISTNLTLTEFAAQYTERIMSRLNDRRYTTILKLFGNDIRKSMVNNR